MKKEKVREQALKELKEEEFFKAVQEEKQRLKTKKTIWERLLPYRIEIKRRK